MVPIPPEPDHPLDHAQNTVCPHRGRPDTLRTYHDRCVFVQYGVDGGKGAAGEVAEGVLGCAAGELDGVADGAGGEFLGSAVAV